MGETTRLEELKRRVEADPASIAFASLAEEYRRAARFDEAVEASRAGLRFHPTYVSARVTLGRSLMELGLYDQAERELHVVARSTPDNLAARRALGDLYWRQADLVRALEQLRLAAGLAPGDGELTELVRELELEVAASQPPAEEPAAGDEAAAAAGVELPAQAAIEALERFYRAIVRRRAASQQAETVEVAPHATGASGRRADRDPPGQLGPRQLTGDRRRCHGAVVTHPFSGRHARVAETLLTEGVDALVVVNSSNIRYLTGFAGTAGVLVVTAGCLYLLVDFRYSSAVARLVRDGVAPPALVPVSLEGSAGYDRRLAELVAAEGWSRVGFEDAHVSVQRARQWGELFAAAGTQAALVGVTDAVERPRLVKDAGEIETLREAGRLLSAVAVDVLEHVIRAGRTELEMAADIDWRVKRAGFEKPAFDTIVASGPNSALPHARPTARRAEAGELVVVDFGGMLRGYAVDLTRTVGLGPVPDEARRIYEAVLEAQEAAIAAAGRPEVTTGEVDAAARDTLARHGLDGVFGHGTGHGLGLDVHEAPRLSRRSAEAPGTDRLEAGMVFTIEPGAYVDGTGGVRIEDDVVRLDGGCALLTDVPRAWRVIPA